MSSVPRNVTYRAAMEVSKDENFNEIYSIRYKKYCLLLAKEKEYLRQLEGHRRRSATLNQEVERFETFDSHKRPSLPTSSKYQYHHSTSLTDMRKTPKIILSRDGRKLSTSYEEITDINDSPPNKRLHTFSNTPHKTLSSNKYQYELLKNKSDSNLGHSKSCENLLSINSSSSNSINRNLDINNNNISRRIHLRDVSMTSSTQNLSERNVRNIDRHHITKHLSSIDQKRRFIEARVKQRKRGEKLKELDDDFNKAREILQKFKSNESLNNLRLNAEENLSEKRNSWIT